MLLQGMQHARCNAATEPYDSPYQMKLKPRYRAAALAALTAALSEGSGHARGPSTNRPAGNFYGTQEIATGPRSRGNRASYPPPWPWHGGCDVPGMPHPEVTRGLRCQRDQRSMGGGARPLCGRRTVALVLFLFAASCAGRCAGCSLFVPRTGCHSEPQRDLNGLQPWITQQWDLYEW
jgi:hypothetical protein